MLSALPVMKTASIKSLPVLPVRRPTAKPRGLFGRLWKCGMKSRVLSVRNIGKRSCAALLISITRWSRTAVWTAIRRLRSYKLIFLNLWCRQRDDFLHLIGKIDASPFVVSISTILTVKGPNLFQITNRYPRPPTRAHDRRVSQEPAQPLLCFCDKYELKKA